MFGAVGVQLNRKLLLDELDVVVQEGLPNFALRFIRWGKEQLEVNMRS